MEQNCNMNYETYSGYEFVSRKNKKKRRQRSKQFSSPEELKNESDTQTVDGKEPVGDTATDDNTSEVESDEVSTKDDSRLHSVESNDIINHHRHVFRDAMMKAPPAIASPEVENISVKQIPLENVNEMCIQDNKVIDGERVDEASNVPLLINKNALSKYASTYELEKFKKNALVIFNQENVDGHQQRLGTEKDVASLTKTFEHFGFEVVEHKDFTKDEVFRELKTFTEKDFTDYGCVAVAVLTHGSNNGLLRAKDQQYSEIEIINHFKVLNKPTLVTKPKIIIIQACRGTKIVPGAPVFHSGKVRKDLDEDMEPYILPVESDLLILHSSYGGSPSHRNELYGTWFIQELCRKVDALAPTQDLESIITEVKREVAINKQYEEYNRRTFEMDINKQMPVMTSTLIRKLYLRKFGEVPRKLETSSSSLHHDQKRGSVSNESKNEVLDSAVPSTPLLVQFGPCSCFLDHFSYMRNCLKFFIEENPYDETARNFLEVAETFEEGVEFNTAKEKMSKAISKHLMNNARSCQYYKYLYFYKH